MYDMCMVFDVCVMCGVCVLCVYFFFFFFPFWCSGDLENGMETGDNIIDSHRLIPSSNTLFLLSFDFVSPARRHLLTLPPAAAVIGRASHHPSASGAHQVHSLRWLHAALPWATQV